VTIARETHGEEGFLAASYHWVTTLQLNAAGELVARDHSTSAGSFLHLPIPVGDSSTEWWRMPRAANSD
jgi:hypothetical protein